MTRSNGPVVVRAGDDPDESVARHAGDDVIVPEVAGGERVFERL